MLETKIWCINHKPWQKDKKCKIYNFNTLSFFGIFEAFGSLKYKIFS